MKGKKCALIGRYFGKWVSPIGVSPVVCPSWERYTMLETGVIDMTLDPIDLTDSTKNYEQAPWVIDNPITRASWNSLWMNIDAFEELPKDVQEIFLDVGKEIEIRAGETLVSEWEQNVEKKWREKGLKWTQLSPEDMQKWADSVEDIPAEWAAEVTEQGYPGWELVRRYIEIAEELGHKWPRQWGVKK
jgi:TRAP-type C4-dicarboxylate transport system substrate-binding protein